MGKRIKAAVLAATGLTVSVGIAATKYVAKVASGYAKPDGLTVIAPEDATGFLAPLSVDWLWGAGPKTAARLRAAGYHTIGDVANAHPAKLIAGFGAQGSHFFELANARDPRRVEGDRRERSLGSERTLAEDVFAHADIVRHLKRSADRIARRLRARGLRARGIRVRLKTADFRLLSRQCALSDATDVAAELFAACTRLLDRFDDPGPFRLVGMAAHDLVGANAPTQFDLLDDGTRRRLETTLDALAARFGDNAVRRARDISAEVVNDSGPHEV